MKRNLVASAVIGAFTYLVYMVAGGTLDEQMKSLVDAKLNVPTHIATCSTKLSETCIEKAVAAKMDVHEYDVLRFPVVITDIETFDEDKVSHINKDVQLPPMDTDVFGACFKIVDWSKCSFIDASNDPAVVALFGKELPFTTDGTMRGCVRPNRKNGLQCMRRDYFDGGIMDFGDRNVFSRSEAIDVNTCESVECSVMAGDDPETAL